MIRVLRKFPHFKGKFWMIRLLINKQLKIKKNVIINGKYGLKYFVPNLKENIAFEIFANGIYEQETSDFIIEKLPPGGTLLDIGANIGSIAIPVCKLRQDVKVICAEASAKVFGYLQKNIAINKIENCILLNRAISDTDNKEILFYSPDELFGKGSVVSTFDVASEKMKTITVDTLLHELKFEKLHFIKIDIEGYEYYAFKGAKKILIELDAPDILFEFIDYAERADGNLNPGDAQKFLLHCGYSLYKISKNNKLIKLTVALEKGEAMLFATKKNAG